MALPSLRPRHGKTLLFFNAACTSLLEAKDQLRRSNRRHYNLPVTMLVRFLRLSPAAFLAPLVLFWGLASHGADTNTQAALLCIGLLGTLALALLTSPREALHAALRAHVVSIGAAVAFLAWSALTAWPLAPPLAQLKHPLAAPFLWEAPTISLAPASTLLTLVVGFAPLAAFVLGAIAGVDRDVRAASVRAILALISMLALLALSRFANNPHLRLDAGLSSANTAATLFGALSVLGIASVLRATRRRANDHYARLLPPPLRWAQGAVSAPLSTIAVLLGLACMTLTASRAGLAAFLAGSIVLAATLLSKRGQGQRAWPFVGVAVCAVFLVLYGSGYMAERMGTAFSAFDGRGQLFEAHLQVFLQRPWLGQGLGSYDQTNGMVITLDNLSVLRTAGAVHNIFLQALEQCGIIGTSLIMLALAPCFFRAFAAIAQIGPGREWAAALLGVSAVFLLHGLVDFALLIPAVGALYGFCLGLLTPVRPPRDEA